MVELQNRLVERHVVKHGLDWTRKTWTGLGKHGLSPGFVKHGLSPDFVKHGLSPGFTNHGLSPCFIKPGLSPCFTKPGLSPFLYQNIVLNVYFNVLYQARQSILQM